MPFYSYVTRLMAASLLFFWMGAVAFATPSKNPDVLKRRGIPQAGAGSAPQLTLTSPTGGWTSSQMFTVEGKCSDTKADPIFINLNGTRYYARAREGKFSRKFPASRGQNALVVECTNTAGVARKTVHFHANIPAVGMKLVLTSDTDDVYTDLHIFEPDNTHVYWASTHSPTGGLFFLNNEGTAGEDEDSDFGSFDRAGYGPYMYIHPSPAPGLYRVEANYWPGGAVRHTLASLDIRLDEGTAFESKRRVQTPLATPGETVVLAYIYVPGNRQKPRIWAPHLDPTREAPPGALEDIEQRKSKKKSAALWNQTDAQISAAAEHPLRESIANLALHQAQRLSPRWSPQQRDCAGLVRFAYREALQRRSPQQREANLLPSILPFPSVPASARKALPTWPMFWKSGETKRSFFVDAESLVGWNFHAVKGGLAQAKPGDLLVFQRQPGLPEGTHLMIYAGGRGAGVVVYHNGARGPEAAVRVVSVDDLLKASDPQWIPVSGNPVFQGIWRWNAFT